MTPPFVRWVRGLTERELFRDALVSLGWTPPKAPGDHRPSEVTDQVEPPRTYVMLLGKLVEPPVTGAVRVTVDYSEMVATIEMQDGRSVPYRLYDGRVWRPAVAPLGGLSTYVGGSTDATDAVASDLAEAWLVLSDVGEGGSGKGERSELPEFLRLEWAKDVRRRLRGYAEQNARPSCHPWTQRAFDQFPWAQPAKPKGRRGTVDEYELVRLRDSAIVFRLHAGPGMRWPRVPDWIVRDIPDYEPDDYEWRNTATDERIPAQPIRRFVFLPPDDATAEETQGPPVPEDGGN